MKIAIVILIVIVIVQSLVIFNLKINLHQTKLSKNLWHKHAIATANWRMDHYRSDYSYLTTRRKNNDRLVN